MDSYPPNPPTKNDRPLLLLPEPFDFPGRVVLELPTVGAFWVPADVRCVPNQRLSCVDVAGIGRDQESELPLEPNRLFGLRPKPLHDRLVIGMRFQRAFSDRADELHAPGRAIERALLQTIFGCAHDFGP